MLALSGAYVVYYILRRQGGRLLGRAHAVVVVSALAIGFLLALATLAYPVAATIVKTNSFQGPATLDGVSYLERHQPYDFEAVTWLNENVKGVPVILEAPGGSYSQFGRVSVHTGLPTVLGWDGHELQWRGSGAEASRRKGEIERIFLSQDSREAQGLLAKYHVEYVYVGALEREAYGGGGARGLEKFADFADVIHRNQGVIIYKVRSQE